jgi:hypothetical protein
VGHTKSAAVQASQGEGGFNSRPSARLSKHRQANPWGGGTRQGKTNFAYVYSSGGIPCRINHGSIKNHLEWTIPPEECEYMPLLVTCAEGLSETEHPYVFVARTAFQALLQAPGGAEKALPLTSELILPIRTALMSKSEEVWQSVLHAIKLLSIAVKGALNPHLPVLLIQINKKAFSPKFQEQITDTLQALEENGGPECMRVIKAKVPTYQSVHFQ